MNNKNAAILAIILAFICMAASLVSGHRAQANLQPSLVANSSDVALTVTKAADLLIRNEERILILDIRDADAFSAFHLPRAERINGLSDTRLSLLFQDKEQVLLVAEKDEDALEFIKKAVLLHEKMKFYYLKDGVREWYLTFALPVSLFASKAAPAGYKEAVTAVKEWFRTKKTTNKAQLLDQLATLQRLAYTPDLLGSSKKAAPSGGGKKKISGGCE
jgi:rhodanese-related sulfurtransferase